MERVFGVVQRSKRSEARVEFIWKRSAMKFSHSKFVRGPKKVPKSSVCIIPIPKWTIKLFWKQWPFYFRWSIFTLEWNYSWRFVVSFELLQSQRSVCTLTAQKNYFLDSETNAKFILFFSSWGPKRAREMSPHTHPRVTWGGIAQKVTETNLSWQPASLIRFYRNCGKPTSPPSVSGNHTFCQIFSFFGQDPSNQTSPLFVIDEIQGENNIFWKNRSFHKLSQNPCQFKQRQKFNQVES